MAITIKDISKKAAVSTATVSKVLNGDYSKVSEKTKDRVLNIAKEMNYRPNRLARSLVKRSSNLISLLVPDITNPYHAEFSRGVFDGGDKFGYQIILCNTDEKIEKEQDFIDIASSYDTAGIIINGNIATIGENIDFAKSRDIPYVTVDNYREGDEYALYVDNYLGSFLATEHLIQNGHKKIAYIGERSKDSDNYRNRFNGYLGALEQYNIDISSTLVYIDSYQTRSGYNHLNTMLKRKEEFTAVVCGNDMIALGAIMAIKENGLGVPEDISVVGFDDIFLATIINPPLTTVRQPAYDIGMRAIEMLIDRIEKRETAAHIVCFTPSLMIRNTVRKID